MVPWIADCIDETADGICSTTPLLVLTKSLNVIKASANIGNILPGIKLGPIPAGANGVIADGIGIALIDVIAASIPVSIPFIVPAVEFIVFNALKA